MEFSWPEFDTKQLLDGERGWTATFDSYDQYRELCYYRVTLLDGEQRGGEFMVVVGTEFAGDDWSGPEFLNELRGRLAAVAADGETNTPYRGSGSP